MPKIAPRTPRWKVAYNAGGEDTGYRIDVKIDTIGAEHAGEQYRPTARHSETCNTKSQARIDRAICGCWCSLSQAHSITSLKPVGRRTAGR